MNSQDYILIAGGLGYIGSHVTVEFLRKNYSVVIVDDLSNTSIDKLDQIHQVLRLEEIPLLSCDSNNITTTTPNSNQLIFETVDLTILADVQDLFKRYSFSCVVLMAGLKHVNYSINNPSLYYRVNLSIANNIVDTMLQHQCRQLIFSGSATVYGTNNLPPYSETCQIGTGLTNPYGETKYLIERILEDICHHQKQLKVISLRYFNPVGAHHSGLLADNQQFVSNLVPVMLKSLITKIPFKVYGNDFPTKDGTPIRDYIHVADVARAHVIGYEQLDAMNGFEAFNVGLGQPVTVLELINLFKKVTNIELNYEIEGRRDGDVAESYASIEKIQRCLQYQSKYSLDEALLSSYHGFLRTNQPKIE